MGVSEAAIHEVTTVAGNVEAEGLRSAGGRTSIQYRERRRHASRPGLPLRPAEHMGRAEPVHAVGAVHRVLDWRQRRTITSQAYTPPDHEIVWGIGMGSRIRRDKLFWFAALDSYQRNDPGLATVKHPARSVLHRLQPSNAQMQLLSAQLGA